MRFAASCYDLSGCLVLQATGYFADLIQALGEAGYRESTDLFGAPYDFRLAADGLEQVPRGPTLQGSCLPGSSLTFPWHDVQNASAKCIGVELTEHISLIACAFATSI